MSLCQSRWSGAKFVQSRASGRRYFSLNVWKELSSHTAIFLELSAPLQNALSGSPMFPAESASKPADFSACVIKLVTVVLPLVPVTAIILPSHARAERSGSHMAAAPASSAIFIHSWSGRKAGEYMISAWFFAASSEKGSSSEPEILPSRLEFSCA